MEINVSEKIRGKRECNLCGKGIYGNKFDYYDKTYAKGTKEVIPICKPCSHTIQSLAKKLGKRAMILFLKLYDFSAKPLVLLKRPQRKSYPLKPQKNKT